MNVMRRKDFPQRTSAGNQITLYKEATHQATEQGCRVPCLPAPRNCKNIHAL